MTQQGEERVLSRAVAGSFRRRRGIRGRSFVTEGTEGSVSSAFPHPSSQVVGFCCQEYAPFAAGRQRCAGGCSEFDAAAAALGPLRQAAAAAAGREAFSTCLEDPDVVVGLCHAVRSAEKHDLAANRCAGAAPPCRGPPGHLQQQPEG